MEWFQPFIVNRLSSVEQCTKYRTEHRNNFSSVCDVDMISSVCDADMILDTYQVLATGTVYNTLYSLASQSERVPQSQAFLLLS